MPGKYKNIKQDPNYCTPQIGVKPVVSLKWWWKWAGRRVGRAEQPLQDQCLTASPKDPEHLKPRATCHEASGVPPEEKTDL